MSLVDSSVVLISMIDFYGIVDLLIPMDIDSASSEFKAKFRV